MKPNSLAIRDREGRYPTANAILVALSAGGRSSRVFLRRADRPLSLPLLQHVRGQTERVTSTDTDLRSLWEYSINSFAFERGMIQQYDINSEISVWEKIF